MPIYEYRCSACGHQKEHLQRISDAPLTDCPECGKGALVKLVSAAGFQLKGTGWYATDFRNSGARRAKEDKPAAKDDKPAAKEDKPAAKQDKAADSSGTDAPKSEAACGSGACPACS